MKTCWKLRKRDSRSGFALCCFLPGLSQTRLIVLYYEMHHTAMQDAPVQWRTYRYSRLPLLQWRTYHYNGGPSITLEDLLYWYSRLSLATVDDLPLQRRTYRYSGGSTVLVPAVVVTVEDTSLQRRTYGYSEGPSVTGEDIPLQWRTYRCNEIRS